MLNTKHKIAKQYDRRGAIVPMFALLLPLLIIFCAFAVNLAYMQVVSTELKIATDCAAHAGGRAMSVAQDDETLTTPEKRELAIESATAIAQQIVNANPIIGRQVSVGGQGSGADIEVGFGRSLRSNNGQGRYDYTVLDTADVASGASVPSSFHVSSNLTAPLPFPVLGSNISSFSPTRRTVATQVNRDVALVLDRSGSMLHFRDRGLLDDTLDELHDTSRTFNRYRLSSDPSSSEYNLFLWVEDGMPIPSEWSGPTETETRPLISDDEHDDARGHVQRRNFSDNVIYQLERFGNPNHTLGLSYSESAQNNPNESNFDPNDGQSAVGDLGELTQPTAMYARDYERDVHSPRFSRSDLMIKGVEAFLAVLEDTPQEELVSLVTFSHEVELEYNLQRSTDDDGLEPFIPLNYPNIRRELIEIDPRGGTAIGDGLLQGLVPLFPDSDDASSIARPFAAKTIVILTDGGNTAGTEPEDAVAQILQNEDATTIHTVTFTSGADRAAMEAIAAAGGGRNFHDDDGSNLVPIFEEIANTLPTILTE